MAARIVKTATLILLYAKSLIKQKTPPLKLSKLDRPARCNLLNVKNNLFFINLLEAGIDIFF